MFAAFKTKLLLLCSWKVSPAQQSCRAAFEGYRKLEGYHSLAKEARCDGIDVVILIDAQLVLEHQRCGADARNIAVRLSLKDLSPGDTILGLLYGFAIQLAEDGFRNVIDSANDALWSEASTLGDLAEFQKTVLFCCVSRKLPSTTPVFHTPRGHFTQALLRHHSGHAQDSHQKWFRHVGGAAK